MVIIVKTTYPPESADEIAKKYLEYLAANPPPEYMKMIGPFVNTERVSGVNVNTIFEVDNEKLADGLVYCGEMMISFRGVPGYTYTIKPWYEIDEALRLIGMG